MPESVLRYLEKSLRSVVLNGQLREPFQGACLPPAAYHIGKRGSRHFFPAFSPLSNQHLCRRTAQDTNTGDRIHVLLSQSSGYSVFFPSRAFLLICGSAFYGDAHCAFVILSPYTNTREGEAPQLGRGTKSCRLGLCVRKCLRA